MTENSHSLYWIGNNLFHAIKGRAMHKQDNQQRLISIQRHNKQRIISPKIDWTILKRSPSN